jgi:hypothetical protein
MTAPTRYWLLRHPRVGRPLTILAWLQLLAATAVGTAPAATAATNAVVLNWTGLHDTSGVPVGDFYLSLASIQDQLIGGGPDARVWDPTTWAPWMMHGLKVMYTNFTAANILTAEAGIFVGIIAVSLWVMRLTISTYWLTVFGEIAKAISTAVITVTTRWGLVAITVPLGVFVGVLAIRRGEAGRGATMILLAIMMPTLALTVFSDPAGMMYGPDGLLMFGRRMGFSTAQAVTHNGAIGGGGFSGQVDTLTSSLITHVVREPLQVFNFGHVVDRVGSCASQYSAALQHGATAASLQGSSDGPVKAMARCGDLAAVHYAQNLDGTNVFVGAVLVLAAVLFGWFMISAGASVFMVSVKAIYTTAKLLPSVLAGGVSGAAQHHARATVWRFFKHPVEAMVLITFVSTMGLAVERLISRPLPAELGGASPFAHVMIMGGASMTALYLLRHIRADLEGRAPGHGFVGGAVDLALGLGLRTGMGGAGKAVLGGARGLGRRLGGDGKTPWERLDEQAAANPARVLGPPQDGFAPVPSESPSTPNEPGEAPRAADGPAAGGAVYEPETSTASNPPVGGVDPVTSTVGAAAAAPGAPPRRQQRRGTRATGQAGAIMHPVLDADPAATPQAGAAAEVAPISGSPANRAPDGWGSGPPLTAYVDHTATDVPLPATPPPEDEGMPPPPADTGRPAATVDPITER